MSNESTQMTTLGDNAWMSEELAEKQKTAISTKADSEMSSGGFLPSFRLFSQGADVTSGNIAAGNFGVKFAQDEIATVGREAMFVPIAARPKALDIRDKNNIRSGTGELDPVYQEIRALSEKRVKKTSHGYEILGVEPSTGKICTWFLGSASQRSLGVKLKEATPPYNDGKLKWFKLSHISKENSSGDNYLIPVAKATDECPQVEIDIEELNKEVGKFLDEIYVEDNDEGDDSSGGDSEREI